GRPGLALRGRPRRRRGRARRWHRDAADGQPGGARAGRGLPPDHADLLRGEHACARLLPPARLPRARPPADRSPSGPPLSRGRRGAAGARGLTPIRYPRSWGEPRRRALREQDIVSARPDLLTELDSPLAV